MHDGTPSSKGVFDCLCLVCHSLFPTCYSEPNKRHDSKPPIKGVFTSRISSFISNMLWYLGLGGSGLSTDCVPQPRECLCRVYLLYSQHANGESTKRHDGTPPIKGVFTSSISSFISDMLWYTELGGSKSSPNCVHHEALEPD